MFQPIQSKTTALRAVNSIRRSLLRRGFLLISLASLMLVPTAQARSPWDPDLGNGNTAEGNGALSSLTTGTDNTAFGFQALFSNTTGSFNTGTGSKALFSNTTGYINTATGFGALLNNTTGTANTANGSQALCFSTVGNENTANGYLALFANTTGNDNTATGANSLSHSTTGSFNSSNGSFALQANTTGSFNTASGSFALSSNTTGDSNIALGYLAGTNVTGGANIDIGNQGVAGESGAIRIGAPGNQTATFIAGIFGTSVAGAAVTVDANGQLGTIVSSQRLKDEIKPMDKASEAILALKPVTFRYKHELDAKGTAQFGLVAEEVEKVNPALVARDAEGKVYTVRYEAVNAMLLNEFLKQHHKVQEQGAIITHLKSTVTQQQKDFQAVIAQQKKEIKALAADLKGQASQIQKVSKQLEVSEPEPLMVDNNQ